MFDKIAIDNGPADNYPSQDAVHPYPYAAEPANPQCPQCQKKMVITTLPYDPYKVFSCPDCNFKTPYSYSRAEPGTANSESGAEHIQTYEGLVDKGSANPPEDNNVRPIVHAPFHTTKRPKENPKSDPMGHGVTMDHSISAFKADQPFPLMIHDEWKIRNELSNMIYGLTYFQLAIGQKNRVDTAMKCFWDAHTLFASYSERQVATLIFREGFMERVAVPVKKEVKAPKAPAEKVNLTEEELSALETVKKRVMARAKRWEEYLVTLEQKNEEMAKYEAKMSKKFNIPKLQEEAEKVLPYLQKFIKMLPQHQATIENVVYEYIEAYTKRLSNLAKLEALDQHGQVVDKLIDPSHLKEWEDIKANLIRISEVEERYSQPRYTDPKKRTPKEITEPAWETLKPEQLTELMKPESSLKVTSDSVWDTLKGWINQLKSLLSSAVNSLAQNQSALEDAETTMAQLAQEPA